MLQTYIKKYVSTDLHTYMTTVIIKLWIVCVCVCVRVGEIVNIILFLCVKKYISPIVILQPIYR